MPSVRWGNIIIIVIYHYLLLSYQHEHKKPRATWSTEYDVMMEFMLMHYEHIPHCLFARNPSIYGYCFWIIDFSLFARMLLLLLLSTYRFQ